MQRADLLLVELGLATNRTHAQRLIKNKKVEIETKRGWELLNKPGIKLDSDSQFRVEADPTDRFVSRGALKLVAALEHANIDANDLCAIDVGQSTGGFTDCLLQAGAAKVVGIEVGHDQLATKLRNDPKVICYEGMNARELASEELLKHGNKDGFDIAVMDVSFISQSKILPSLIPLIRAKGILVSLVKPQFEVGKDGVGRGGIVRDQSLYPAVKDKIQNCCEALGMQVTDYIESPITGGDGNREFLLIAKKL